MTVTPTLVSGQSPQLVQIVIDSIADGDLWNLVGVVGEVEPGLLPGADLYPDDDVVPEDTVFTPTGYAWRVPGGSGVGDGGQVVLVDNRAPGNLPYVYVLTTTSGEQTSDPVTVPFEKDIVLQTLDGQQTIDLDLMAGSLGIDLTPSVATFRVPGRERPVTRYDVMGDVESALVVEVPMGSTAAFRAVIASGAPIVYRFGGDSYDLAPVGVVQLTSVRSEPIPTARLRHWTLGYTLIDDPNRDIRLGAFTWDTFDESTATLDWDDFDAAFTGLTWDQFDTTDWASF